MTQYEYHYNGSLCRTNRRPEYSLSDSAIKVPMLESLHVQLAQPKTPRERTDVASVSL